MGIHLIAFVCFTISVFLLPNRTKSIIRISFSITRGTQNTTWNMTSLGDLINLSKLSNMKSLKGLLSLTQPYTTLYEDQHNLTTSGEMSSLESYFKMRYTGDMTSVEDLLNLTQPGDVTSPAGLLNLTNLKNLEDILGTFKQTLTTSVDLSLSVFYSLVRNYFKAKFCHACVY